VNALERNEAMRRAGRDYRTVIVDHTLTMREFVVYVVTIGVAKYKQLSPPDAVRQLFESYLLPYSGDLLDPYLFRDLLIELNEEDDEDPKSLRAMVYNHSKQLHKLFNKFSQHNSRQSSREHDSADADEIKMLFWLYDLFDKTRLTDRISSLLMPFAMSRDENYQSGTGDVKLQFDSFLEMLIRSDTKTSVYTHTHTLHRPPTINCACYLLLGVHA
jgi:hypothetical protein